MGLTLKKIGKISLMIGFWCLGNDSQFRVPHGHQAVVHHFMGYRDKVFTEGKHHKIPLFESVKMFDVRERTHVIETHSPSFEDKMVRVVIEVRIHPRQILTFVKNHGDNYDGVVNQLTKSAVSNSSIAQYYLDELVAKKEIISDEIKKYLEAELGGSDVIIDDICIISMNECCRKNIDWA